MAAFKVIQMMAGQHLSKLNEIPSAGAQNRGFLHFISAQVARNRSCLCQHGCTKLQFFAQYVAARSNVYHTHQSMVQRKVEMWSVLWCGAHKKAAGCFIRKLNQPITGLQGFNAMVRTGILWEKKRELFECFWLHL